MVWLKSKKNNFQLRTLILGPGCVVFFICIKISIEHFKANSENLNQPQHSVAFDPGLHCLCPIKIELGLDGLKELRSDKMLRFAKNFFMAVSLINSVIKEHKY